MFLLHWNLSHLTRAFLAAPTEHQYLRRSCSNSHAAWFYDAFHVFLVEPRNTIKAQLIQAKKKESKKVIIINE